MATKQTAFAKTKSSLKKFSLIFIFLIMASVLVSGQTKKYIKKYRPIADSLGKVYGIPPSVILGVGIVESSTGEGKTAILLNNHFGIVGKNNLKKSHKIKTRYKYYPSVTASYTDFCGLVSRREFYPKLKKNLNYTLWVDAISKSGYSEVPSIWKERVLSVIKKHKL